MTHGSCRLSARPKQSMFNGVLTTLSLGKTYFSYSLVWSLSRAFIRFCVAEFAFPEILVPESDWPLSLKSVWSRVDGTGISQLIFGRAVWFRLKVCVRFKSSKGLICLILVAWRRRCWTKVEIFGAVAFFKSRPRCSVIGKLAARWMTVHLEIVCTSTEWFGRFRGVRGSAVFTKTRRLLSAACRCQLVHSLGLECANSDYSKLKTNFLLRSYSSPESSQHTSTDSLCTSCPPTFTRMPLLVYSFSAGHSPRAHL